MARWHSCNVFHLGHESRRLWQFDARSDKFAVERDQKLAGDATLPNSVQRSWSSIWQPKLNVAWLAADNVFLRVAHLPKASAQETASMVELQLEKLSPIPVTQLVWSFQVLPQSSDDLQTVVVVLAERKAVEEFLGRLEGQGYLADRLEMAVLDELMATEISGDGAWIYPGAWGGPDTALVAWWGQGRLQNLNFVTAPPGPGRGESLGEQLNQMAWAGELEGWLKSTPVWHLVGDEVTAAEWEPLLHEGLGVMVDVVPALSPGQLAALTARRVVRGEATSSLLPTEFAGRYRDQYVDRLWMRGLGAVGLVYLLGVTVYFAALSVQLFRADRVETQVRNLKKGYEDAQGLKKRYEVLKEMQDLKFAALDCWKVLAELMPEGVVLDSFSFSDGRRLRLDGSSPNDKKPEVLEMVDQIGKAQIKAEPLFSAENSTPVSFKDVGPAGANSVWSCGYELKRSEVK